jgi:hypothetical protein
LPSHAGVLTYFPQLTSDSCAYYCIMKWVLWTYNDKGNQFQKYLQWLLVSSFKTALLKLQNLKKVKFEKCFNWDQCKEVNICQHYNSYFQYLRLSYITVNQIFYFVYIYRQLLINFNVVCQLMYTTMGIPTIFWITRLFRWT